MKNKGCLFTFIFIALIVVGIFSWMLIQTGTVQQTLGSPAQGISLPKQLIYATRLHGEEDTLIFPVNSIEERVTVQIDPGMSSKQIAVTLYANNLITSKQSFQSYLIYKGYDRTLQTGYYSFSRQMPPIEIAQHLANGTSRFAVLNITPGWRLEQIAAQIPALNINVTQEEFLTFTQSPPATYTYAGGIPAGSRLEGVILPGQYLLQPDADLTELMQTFATTYEDTRTTLGSNLSATVFYDAVKIASIIQREAFHQDEYALMASVFYNRLDANMLLQMDSTVQYALGYDQDQQTWWRVNLAEQLYFDSAYNTYVYKQLPPTPISSPSKEAIQAAISPQSSTYLFFQADCDGSMYHNFTETYDEHLENNCN
jgi:UPF0755 protein